MIHHVFIASNMDTPVNRILVSSMRVLPGKQHDKIEIFNRGGKAGELLVTAGDADEFVRRLTES